MLSAWLVGRRHRLPPAASLSSLFATVQGIEEAMVPLSSPQGKLQRHRFAFFSAIARSELPKQPCLVPCSYHLQNYRFFSTGLGENLEADIDMSPSSYLEELALGLGSEVADGRFGYEESSLPVQALIMLMEKAHDITGLPWGMEIDGWKESSPSLSGCSTIEWKVMRRELRREGSYKKRNGQKHNWYPRNLCYPMLIRWMMITSSTLVLRLVLFPVLILQLNKLRKIAESLPKLPPPLPPLFSGRSYFGHILHFRKERRAIGCPSCLWFIANFFLQVPCFLLWMTSIRRMSLDHHPGFDTGGALWFPNLCELPHGSSISTFPFMIAMLHFANVQLSFRTSPKKFDSPKSLVAKLYELYKIYLNILTLPVFITAFWLPQGSLVYWLTNATFTLIQQLFLMNPAIREQLGIPRIETNSKVSFSENKELHISELSNPLTNRHLAPAKSLSPHELLVLAVKRLADGQHDKAMPLLQLALVKDPDYIRALILMGQLLLREHQFTEAISSLESAISKLHLKGHLTEAEDIDMLILASQWAGSAHIRQGRDAKGLIHLQNVATLNEPDDAKSKAHYFDGLFLLSSALYREGRKDEAAVHLRRLVAYDPAYKEFLDQCEEEEPLDAELSSSRRGDY